MCAWPAVCDPLVWRKRPRRRPVLEIGRPGASSFAAQCHAEYNRSAPFELPLCERIARTLTEHDPSCHRDFLSLSLLVGSRRYLRLASSQIGPSPRSKQNVVSASRWRRANRRSIRESLEFFESKIRPLLVARCQRCHGPEKQEASLRLDSRASILKGGDSGPAIVPHEPDQSLMIDAIRYGDTHQMPPKQQLPAEEIALLEEWVRRGGPWPSDEIVQSDCERGRLRSSEAKTRPLGLETHCRSSDSQDLRTAVAPRRRSTPSCWQKLDEAGLERAKPGRQKNAYPPSDVRFNRAATIT